MHVIVLGIGAHNREEKEIIEDMYVILLTLVIRDVYSCFFFSSRRRHTRLQGDWSSDVCSSDLGAYYLTYGPEAGELAEIDPAKQEPRPHVYRTAQEAELSYEHGMVKLHDLAEYRSNKAEGGGHVLTTVGRIIYNDRIKRALGEALGEDFDVAEYEFVNRSMRKRGSVVLVGQLVQTYGVGAIAQV